MDSEFRYRAFISYSHSDEQWAKWLHKSLETYSVPKHLVGTETPLAPCPSGSRRCSAIATSSRRRPIWARP